MFFSISQVVNFYRFQGDTGQVEENDTIGEELTVVDIESRTSRVSLHHDTTTNKRHRNTRFGTSLIVKNNINI